MSLRTLACAALLLAGLPSAVSAQDAPATAVAPFTGRLAPTMRRAVERAIGERADLVDSDRARDAAEEAGVEGLEPDGVTALASSVGAVLIVQGHVSGSRRVQTVELVIRHADGTELARGNASYRRGRRFAARFERAVRRVFSSAVEALASHVPPEPERVEAPPEEPPEEEPSPSVRPNDGLAVATILGQVTIRGRSTRVEFDTEPPRVYESGPYAELGLAFEVRPFANDAHLGRGIFVTGSFAHSVGLGSEVMNDRCNADPTADGCAVSTNFVRFLLGAGWLAPIDTIAEIGVGLAGGIDGYYLSPNEVLPTAEYTFVRPSVRGRIRFLQETLVLDLEVGYRGMVGIGDMARSFGSGYEAHGVDVGAGLGGNLFLVADLGFTWGVRFDWVGYFLSFSEAAEDTPATSGSDSAVRVTISAGWSFR